MGYLIAAVLGVIVLAIFIGALAKSAGPAKGRIKGDVPVGANGPAADAPTPGRSDMADSQTAANADKNTPAA